MNETALVRELLIYLSSRQDCVVWRAQPLVARARSGRVMHSLPNGHADIAGVLKQSSGIGQALFVEAKVSTKQSEPQRVFQTAVEKHGALYILAHSIADVEAALPCL